MDLQTAAILDHISDALSVLDRDWRYVYANRTAALLAGKEPRDLTGQVLWEVFPEAVDTPFHTALLRAASSQVTVELEEFYPPFDRWFQVRAHPTPGGLAVYAQDVTERRRAQDELAERTRLLALAAEVGSALVRGDTLQEMLRECAAALVRHLDAAFARIWTLNEVEQVLELQASAGMYTHINGPHGRVPVGQLKIGLIAQERKPHLTNSVIGDPRVGDQEWAKREGMVAFAGYPLVVEDRLAGVMAMFARHALSEATLNAMSTVANEIALGIERKQHQEELSVLLLREQEARREAELLAEEVQAHREELEVSSEELQAANEELLAANEELQWSAEELRGQQERQAVITRYLRAANRAAARVAAATERDEMLQIAVQTLEAEFGACVAGVWLRDEHSRRLRVCAGAALDRAATPSIEPEIDASMHPYKIGWVARTRRPFIGSALADDLQFDQSWLAREGIAAAAILPLAGKEQLAGVMAAFFREELPLEAGEVLGTLTTILASALEHQRLLAARHGIPE